MLSKRPLDCLCGHLHRSVWTSSLRTAPCLILLGLCLTLPPVSAIAAPPSADPYSAKEDQIGVLMTEVVTTFKSANELLAKNDLTGGCTGLEKAHTAVARMDAIYGDLIKLAANDPDRSSYYQRSEAGYQGNRDTLNNVIRANCSEAAKRHRAKVQAQVNTVEAEYKALVKATNDAVDAATEAGKANASPNVICGHYGDALTAREKSLLKLDEEIALIRGAGGDATNLENARVSGQAVLTSDQNALKQRCKT